jgi:hypothetical protein
MRSGDFMSGKAFWQVEVLSKIQVKVLATSNCRLMTNMQPRRNVMVDALKMAIVLTRMALRLLAIV